MQVRLLCALCNKGREFLTFCQRSFWKNQVLDQYQAVESQRKVVSPWVDRVIDHITQELNGLDLVFFGLGAFFFFVLLIFFLRRRTRLQSDHIKKYQKDIESIKKGHLEEIIRIERSLELLKDKLEGIEGEFEKDFIAQEVAYQKRFKETKAAYAKQMQKIEKKASQIRSVDEHTIFQLKQRIHFLTSKQMIETQDFKKEIKDLKGKIREMKKRHAQVIKEAEMEISDLRKQMQVLMYRV